MLKNDEREPVPRVLLIAEAANPEWASVPLEGWSHSQALARVCDTHLVTQIRNAAALRRAGLVAGEGFTPIDSEAVARRVWRLENLLRGGAGRGWTTLTALRTLPYRYFERLVWKQFGPAIRSGRFDVVHRLTPLSPTTPSRLARLCRKAGVPFVLGPLNGGVPWPRGFDSARRREREWLSYLRGAYRLVPGYRSTRENAAAIVVGSKDTLAQVPARYRPKCVYVPENGIDPERFPPAAGVRPAPPPLRLAFVGRLVPYKGADMLLRAAGPLLREGRAVLDVIGDGPEMAALRALADEERLTDAVTFTGWLEHPKLAERLARAHVFAFPSVREFGGAVVLEAMMLGVVPVVLAYGGPAELVTERTGFAIPMGTRQDIVGRLGAVLEHLAGRPAQLQPLSDAARRRVLDHFTWDAKARQVLEVYRWVLGRREKPDFGMPLPDAPPAVTPDS